MPRAAVSLRCRANGCVHRRRVRSSSQDASATSSACPSRAVLRHPPQRVLLRANNGSDARGASSRSRPRSKRLLGALCFAAAPYRSNRGHCLSLKSEHKEGPNGGWAPTSGPQRCVPILHGLRDQPAQNRGSADHLIADRLFLNDE